MNTLELITSAFYLSGVLSRTLQTISSTQTSDGLTLLNDIIAEQSINASFIPYFSHTTFNTVEGQEIYSIQGLVDLAELTFNVDSNVRFPMVRDNQRRYFGMGRVDNVESLPFHYYAERQLNNVMLIYMYFIPDQSYQVNITGKYALQQLALFDDLSAILDAFYISYLKYKLAKRICDFYVTTFPPQLEPTLAGMESNINKLTGTDLSIKRNSMFRYNNFNYAQANLGRGWTPPGGGY